MRALETATAPWSTYNLQDQSERPVTGLFARPSQQGHVLIQKERFASATFAFRVMTPAQKEPGVGPFRSPAVATAINRHHKPPASLHARMSNKRAQVLVACKVRGKCMSRHQLPERIR